MIRPVDQPGTDGGGRTGLVARCDDQVAAVLTLDIADSPVVQVWAVLNPDKLRSWNRSLPG